MKQISVETLSAFFSPTSNASKNLTDSRPIGYCHEMEVQHAVVSLLYFLYYIILS